jgi:putative FmdB family regulatory protein
MPLYDYKCPAGHLTDLQRPIAERNNPGEGCPECGGKLELQVSAPMLGTERPNRDPMKRAIFSEKQAEAQVGKDWRDAGTTRQPGGIGRKKIFT